MYNYYESVKKDAKAYMLSHYNLTTLKNGYVNYSETYGDVTGYKNGSYTNNRDIAKALVLDNYALLEEVEVECVIEDMIDCDDWEEMDIHIRGHVLWAIFEDVKKEAVKELEIRKINNPQWSW